MDKCHPDVWQLVRMAPETNLLNLVKIGSVKAELLLIWQMPPGLMFLGQMSP